jgi:YfiH family protein
VGDAPARVLANRELLARVLPAEPLWLDQVHGTRVIEFAAAAGHPPAADGALARRPGQVLAVMTADCLPVLLADRAGSVVAVVHAGWRGLAAGVIEEAVRAMGQAPGTLLAWLGPAIGPLAYEVGAEVREAFVRADPGAAAGFAARGADRPGKYLADLYALARHRLSRLGVEAVYGGRACTYSEPQRFFSYRRDGETGRMATLIWLE